MDGTRPPSRGAGGGVERRGRGRRYKPAGTDGGGVSTRRGALAERPALEQACEHRGAGHEHAGAP